MSPNYDELEKVAVSPVMTGYWSPTLSTATQQTAQRYPAAQKLAKQLGVKCVVTSSCRLKLTNIGPGMLLIVRYGVVLVTTTEVKVLAAYVDGMLTVGSKHLAVTAGHEIGIKFESTLVVRLWFRRVPKHHVPFILSVRKCATEVLEPGFHMWYATLEPGRHIALLQQTCDGRFYCVADGCKKSFKTITEWKNHYTISFHLPKLFRADFSDGEVCPRDLPLRTVMCDVCPITTKIEKCGWEYRSLNDKRYRKHMWADVCRKLS